MPTSANCDAPVNISSDRAHVWSSDRPAAVEIAPNESAYAPLAIPIPTASRITPERGLADGAGKVDGD
jgi:hypothetical protein